MAASRQALIPIMHVIAEVAALPLASEIALSLGLAEIDPTLSSPATRELWRQGEGHLLRSFPGFSVDEAVAVRDRTWFREIDGPAALPLHEYVQLVARRYLSPVGTVAHPWLRYLRPDDDRVETDRHIAGRTGEADDRRAWRWMSFALPSDLLLAALRPHEPPVRVHLLSPPVATLLAEHGFAETHLHLGAALDFPLLWAAATCCIGRYDFHRDACASPGALLHEGRDIAPWLIRACLTRFLLGAYLAWGRKEAGIACLSDFFDFDRAPWLAAMGTADALRLPLQEALKDTYQGRLGRSDNFRALQQAYQKLTGVSVQGPPRRLDEVQRLDPLSRWFGGTAGREGPSVELDFLAKAFLYLEGRPHDALFARLFWQTVRVRCLLFRHCIQRPLTPGLQYFIRFYERKASLTKLLSRVELESAARLCGAGRGLKSLEVRMRPVRDAYLQGKELEALDKQFRKLHPADDPARPEFGVVLHFLKSRGKSHDEGVPPAFDGQGASDPTARANIGRFRFSNILLRWWAEARAIANALQKQPKLLGVLRGFDICRDETGIPTWVYAPVFRWLISKCEEAARDPRCRARRYAMVRLTSHVGEDFVHLLGGLRAMDEALRDLQLRSGDRVGHGLALGVDPLPWARKTAFVPLPREDRWLDLIWEHQVHGRQGVQMPPQRLAAIEREIVALSRQIFGPKFGRDFHSPHDAISFVQLLHDEQALEDVGFPSGQIPRKPDSQQKLLIEYLTNPRLFRRARVVEWVRTEDEGEALVAIQEAVRRNFAEAGIVIEINPISNLLVGDLGDLTSHPLWRLSPPAGGVDVSAPLPVCIGSDDPLPFVTNLPDEYQFLYDALILAGRTHAEARDWLNQARLAGLEGRFTLPRVAD
jgi:hypothetical protein